MSIPILPPANPSSSAPATPSATPQPHPKPPITIVYSRRNLSSHQPATSNPSLPSHPNLLDPPSTTAPPSSSTNATSPPHQPTQPCPPPKSTILPPAKPITTRLANNIRKPNPKYAKVATLHSSPENLPNTVKQALILPQWCNAMDDEYQALERNHTWTLVPRSHSQNVIGCKWVFRNKYNPDGTLKQHKARLLLRVFINARVLTILKRLVLL